MNDTRPPPRLLLIGANSAMAHAVARRWAARHARIALLGRNADALAANADDLRVRGAAEVTTHAFDALDTDRNAGTIESAFAALGGADAALIAFGTLPDQRACEESSADALRAFDVNARSVLAVLTPLANIFERQGRGVIAVLSSPAGERGRASNYVYGAAKAAVSTLCSGLRHRLDRHGVKVTVVLPGFVDSPMTAGIQKGPLWAKPEQVAIDIDRALTAGPARIYTPWFWRWIMLIVRSLPDRIFIRTRR